MLEIFVKAYELVYIYALGIFCALIYIFAGVMVLVKKNTLLISKKNKYNEPKMFCTIYGIVEIVGASLALVFLVLGIFLKDLYILFFILTAIVVVTMVLILFMVNTKFRIMKK